MSDKPYRITLDFFGTQGAWHALMQTEVKGRSQVRDHSRAFRALKTQCMKMTTETEGTFIGGTIELDESRYDYLREIADKKLTAGVPGTVGEGYAALLDAMDVAKAEHDKVEVKA